MTQKKNRKYFESKISNLENKMDAARVELLAVGDELLYSTGYNDDYESAINNNGLTFILKEDCIDPFCKLPELSPMDLFKDEK